MRSDDWYASVGWLVAIVFTIAFWAFVLTLLWGWIVG